MNDVFAPLTRTARRATFGRTVLDTLAVVFLGCALAFWSVLNWSLFVPPDAGLLAALPQKVAALALTLVLALATPLLLSMLVPTTPAGQALQRTQWRTIGFPVIIVAAGVLFWRSLELLRAWLESQPVVAASGLVPHYLTACIVAFVVVPALAWVQVSPERWLREIQLAHAVRKLELEQAGELAIIKARLLWAEQRAAISYARLLPAEQKEVADTLRGLLMGIADTQRSIARTVGIQASVERQVLGDDEIANTLDYVAQQLERPALAMDVAITEIDDAGRRSGSAPADQIPPANENERSQSSMTAPAADAPGRPRTPQDADVVGDPEYTIAIDHIHSPVWIAQDVADVLHIDKTTAQKKIRRWLAAGWICETRLGHYRFEEAT